MSRKQRKPSRFWDAAIEAEQEVSRRQESPIQARRHVVVRIARMVGGITLIVLGVLGLLLPVLPGWILIIPGLGLLPYRWAARLRGHIRQRAPGVPNEGPIPARVWVISGGVMLGFTAASLIWGNALKSWISGMF